MKLIDVVVGGASFVRNAFGLVEVKNGDGPNWNGAARWLTWARGRAVST